MRVRVFRYVSERFLRSQHSHDEFDRAIFLVTIAKGSHLFPSRTQPLSPSAQRILGLKIWEGMSSPGKSTQATSLSAFFCFKARYLD